MGNDRRMAGVILASDYDGTLSQGGISDTVRAAICRFRAAGGRFGVVSGRDYAGGYAMFRRENRFPFDFVLGLNGAIAFDARGSLLFADEIRAPELMVSLRRFLFDNVATMAGFYFRYSALRFDSRYPNGHWSGTGMEYSPHDRIGAFTGFCGANTFCDTEEDAMRGTEAIRKAFPMLNPMRNGRCIDIAPAGMDKGEGIARYAARYAIAHDRIYTAGDNDNDVSMLARYHGFAMTVSSPAAAAAAAHRAADIADLISQIEKLL